METLGLHQTRTGGRRRWSVPGSRSEWLWGARTPSNSCVRTAQDGQTKPILSQKQIASSQVRSNAAIHVVDQGLWRYFSTSTAWTSMLCLVVLTALLNVMCRAIPGGTGGRYFGASLVADSSNVFSSSAEHTQSPIPAGWDLVFQCWGRHEGDSRGKLGGLAYPHPPDSL